MDPRRGVQHEYGRSRGGDGGVYGAHPSSSGRAIPPTGVPSLSTGQGFYTVESLQGATMVPPPQPAPPPPRLLPPMEPYARDLPPHRLHPAERRELAPFDRRYPPPPAIARKMMMMPPPDLPLPRRGGPGMLHHPPPPFMGDPRMRGFPPGRRDPRSGWGPGDFEQHAFDRSRDRVGPSLVKRMKAKKPAQRTDKPVAQAKSLSNSVGAADKKSSADKRNTVDGGPGWCALCKIDCCNADSLKKHLIGKRHKKQLESQSHAHKAGDKTEEAKEEGVAMTIASDEAAGKMLTNKDNEQGETIASKEGDMDNTDLNPTEATTVEASKGEGNSQTSEPKPVAGKKRVLKDAVKPKKKPRNSAASDTPNSVPATAGKGSEGVTTTVEGLAELPVPDLKGADPASKKSSISLKSEGDVIEPPTSNKQPVEESVNEGMDGEKEVRNAIDLENGRAGQSAKVQ
ncbi:hypothetical protein L7F22_001127 [Adiantum nelumboides]|nr:hypothetical protein [Adiantum nelumboides]